MELTKTYHRLKEKISEIGIFQRIRRIYSLLASKKWVAYTVFLYLVCFAMFIMTLVRNEFTIPVSGDFTLQEIPFYLNGYDDWWTAIVTGKFVMWDDSAMLGVNNIGANAFYYLFNPFFLVLLIVPRSLLPQAQAFMMITKMVLAGVSMKLLLEQFKVKEETTWLVGTAYAFCGWNLYYLWFNHFLEISVLMPLVLLGIEKVLRERKPMTLVFVLFISGLTNYFFLISFCFCGVLYAIFRFFQNWKTYAEEERNRKEKHLLDLRIEVILQGFFGFAVGLMLCCLILFPCFSVVLENSRVTSQTYLTNLTDAAKDLWGSFRGEGSFKEAFSALWNVMFKWENHREKYLLFPLISFLTPNVSCYDSLVLVHSGYDNAYSSMFIYTPLLLMFIPSVIQAMKKRAVSTTVALLGIGVLLFTPFAYYCFSGFTSVAYARWYIFVTAIACVFIAVQYDRREEMKIWTLDLSFAVIVFFYGYLLYKGEYLVQTNMSNIKQMDERIYYMYGELLYLLFMYLYLRKHYKRPNLTADLRYFVAFEAIVMCNITLIGQGTASYRDLYQGEANIREEMEIASLLKKEDDQYYRVFSTTADRNGNNLGMMLGTPGLGTFHSIYNYNLEDFLDWSSVQYGGRGGWSMGVHEKRINLDEFLGVKYYLLKQGDNNVPFGFSEYLSTDRHVVYRNNNFIELGYAFDTVIVAKDYEDYGSNYDPGAMTYRRNLSSSSKETLYNEKAYLTGAVLYESELKERYGENYVSSLEDFAFLTKREDLKEGIYTTDTVLKNSDITVYYADWKGQPTFDQTYINEGSYGTSVTRDGKTMSNYYNLTWFSYMDIDTTRYGIGSECATRGKCFVSVQARMGENLEITLYGKDETGEEIVLTKDQHMTHWFGKGGDTKKQRGFYVDDEVTKIRIRVLETMDNNRYLLKPYVTYEYEDTYNEQISKLRENPLRNVIKDVNSFAFDTSFDRRKFVVLQIPFDSGWTLKNEKGEQLNLLKGQGGFISFLAEEGDHRYLLSYQTPYLSQGILTMSIGMLCAGGYMIMTLYLSLDKKKFSQAHQLR